MMKDLIIMILVILLCIIFALYTLKISNIKSVTEKLKYLNSMESNTRLKIPAPDKYIEELVLQINKTIDERRKTEEKHRELDLELRQAIANMSHDLRTPLTSIMGYIQLLQDSNISNEDKAEYLSIVEKRAEVLKELISSFYDLSRLQANEYALDMGKVNISNILCELIAAFYDEISKKGLETIVEIDENIPLIYGDKKAINRIFTNMIQNILKHSKGQVKIYLKKYDDYIITEFSNKAPNLDSDDAKRIFERFFTGDRMRTGQNTGLGLAITKILVERQGHEITSEKIDDVLSIKIKWKV